ncbi:helix-turn-helix domain-containing protein [Streptomyces lavendulae]|uniref:helix-turn-helix domain-containing protein n=1 Tax=Streptomyces lavendulae TaxID=1914 RepID=UPI003823D9D5
MPAHWKPVDPASGELSEFAERLRDAVGSNGYSVREITERQGISRSTVYAVLAGERLPSQPLLEQILMVEDPRRRAARASSIAWLFTTRTNLEKARRRRSTPPRPPVELDSVPEQERFAQALNDWVTAYRPHFAYWWPEGLEGGGVSRGWLQRFLEGKAIPSETGLWSLLPREQPRDMDLRLWNQCIAEFGRLQGLALDARRSRRTAREVLRILQGGR